jgi:AAA family ATP:ADP antiporter
VSANVSNTSRAYLAALYVSLCAAFLFCGYELVRSPANTLFKVAYGKAGLPYAMAATPAVVIAFLWIYGRLLTRFGPRFTLILTTLGSCGLLAACWAGVIIGFRPASAALYLLREAYVVLLMEQYWSFLNSILGDARARKLNGPICGVGSAGSIAGAMLVSTLALSLGTASLLLLGAILTLPTVLLASLAYRAGGEPSPDPSGTSAHAHDYQPTSGVLGGQLLLRQRVLALLLIIILLTQAISGLTDLSFQGILQDAIPNADAQTAFSGRFFMWLNIAAAILQFILTPILLRFFPLRGIHLAIPLVHVFTCLYLWRSPTLFAAGAAYMVFKSLDYSLFRAAKELLYIPLSFDARYRAKELIDVFGYRLGKGGMSLAIVALQRTTLTFAEPLFALTAALAALTWAGVAAFLPIRSSGRDRSAN